MAAVRWSRLLQPATDLGVAIQLLLVVALAGLLWRLTRRRPEWRLAVAGTTVLTLALMGLRAAH